MCIARRMICYAIMPCLFLMMTLCAATAKGARNIHVRPKQHTALTLQEQHRLNVQLLAAAYENGNNHVDFRILISKGADPNTRQYEDGRPHTPQDSHTWLMRFSALGEAQTVQVLLDHGAKVNARGRTCFGAEGHGDPDPHNSTALIDACCRSDNWDVIQVLLQHGAHVNVHDNSGNTPLGMAVWQSEWDECQLLLRYGARPDLLNKWERETLYQHIKRR